MLLLVSCWLECHVGVHEGSFASWLEEVKGWEGFPFWYKSGIKVHLGVTWY